MTLVAAEAGGEVARMFEYQLSLLLGAVNAASVSLVADHCAQRAVDYAVNVRQSLHSRLASYCWPTLTSVVSSQYVR